MRRPLTASAMMTPALALVVMFLLLPLVLLFRYSLNGFVPGQFMVDALSPAMYIETLRDPYYRQVLITTVAMAAGVTVICLIVGFPIAQFLARTKSRYKSLMLLAVILPLFVGNAVRAAGWMVAFGQQGLVNSVLQWLDLTNAPIQMMYTTPAVVVGIVSVNLPFVVLTLQSVLEGLNPSVNEASQSLGATPFETWRLVTLPLAMPGIVAAGLLSFILTMNAYATPVLLGGPSFQMMAPVVANEILQKNNWPMGAALSFVLIIVTVVLSVALNVRQKHLQDARG